MTRRQSIVAGLGAATWGGLAWYASRAATGGPSILNASYDATRELYRIINRRFLEKTGVTVRPSFAGSAKQALAVREGLPADVVSLAVWPDTQELVHAGLIDSDWETRFPNRSLPYTSTIVFVVRTGNPKQLLDWPDLIRGDDVRVVAANPKIGGAAKLAYLAAWGATKLSTGESAADRFVQTLYTPARIPVLESSSRAATQTFARKQIGDVQITWESEAILELRELGNRVEIVRPPRSVQAEPHVAVVDANARRHGTESIAMDYVRNLYEGEAQRTMADLGFRPAMEPVRQLAATFGKMDLFRIHDVLPGGWNEAQHRFFDDDGLLDRSYR